MSDLISREDVVKEIVEWSQIAADNEIDMAIKEFLSFLEERIDTLQSAEPTAEEVWSVAQKVFHSTLTYREAVDYVKEVEKQHERFNQQSRCD